MLWPREEFLNLASDCLVRTYGPVSGFTSLLNQLLIQARSSNLSCPHLPPTNLNQRPGDKPGSEEGPSDFSDNSQSKLKSAILDLECSFQTSPRYLSRLLLRLEEKERPGPEISGNWGGGRSSSYFSMPALIFLCPTIIWSLLKFPLSASVKILFIPPQLQQRNAQRICTGCSKKKNTKYLLDRWKDARFGS